MKKLMLIGLLFLSGSDSNVSQVRPVDHNAAQKTVELLHEASQALEQLK